MDDQRIIELYNARNHEAIEATAGKYGNYCLCIAENILFDRMDAEECVNDTWLKAWNAIPPQQPQHLKLFLAKITRNLSLNRYKQRTRDKRGGGEAALTRITIGYTKNRAAVDTLYTVTDHAPLISLAEAEALLAKDYVFSTHVCSFCMRQQDKVDFSTYDHVGLVYLFGETEEDADSIGVPFYVFFKKLSGPGRYSGTYRYAKTYVPAIRVSGLEAYFAEQMQTHHPEDIVD